MEKLNMKTPDLTEKNILQLGSIFPEVITEIQDEQGNLTKGVDFDLLRQKLSSVLVEGTDERYRLDWPGKKASLVKANTPITKTLRPVIQESVDFENTQNIYIEGDNFEALKILQESYLGKVKMIYIDPPYNTGNDFIYDDKFVVDKAVYDESINAIDAEGRKLFRENTISNPRFHSDWLSMMFERLVITRDLLKEDGVIFISIDDNEFFNLRKICDEIFGSENFLATLIWNKQHSQQQGIFKKYHEYVLVYSKNVIEENIQGGDGLIIAGALKKISKENPKSSYKFPAGTRVDAPDGTSFNGTYGDSEKVTVEEGIFLVKENKLLYDVVLSAGWTQKDQMDSWFKGLKTIDSKGQEVKEFFFNSAGKLKCVKTRSRITPSTFLPEFGMVSKQTKELQSLLQGNFFDNPKPIEMIKLFIDWFTDKSDIILDFFSGSSTTAHATIQINSEDYGNRKFIMVQLPEIISSDSEAYKAGYKTIADIGKERIRRAGKKIKEESLAELKKHLADLDKKSQQGSLLEEEDPVQKRAEIEQKIKHIENLDIGFRVYKVDSSNMKDVFYHPSAVKQEQLAAFTSNIKEDRTSEDILTQVILDLGLELSLKIEKKKILANDVFFVQENSLVACFDEKIDFGIIDTIAAVKPLKVVFRDSGFKNDKDRINLAERFKRLSPETSIRVI